MSQAPETVAERLEAIRQREQAATRGNWKLWGMKVCAPKEGFPPDESDLANSDDIAITQDADRGWRTYNATFIACARQDIPWLLTQVQRLRDQKERLSEELIDARDSDAALMAQVQTLRAALEDMVEDHPCTDYCYKCSKARAQAALATGGDDDAG